MCHDLGRVIGTRRTADEWLVYARAMTAQGELQLTDEQLAMMTAYLAEYYGP